MIIGPVVAECKPGQECWRKEAKRSGKKETQANTICRPLLRRSGLHNDHTTLDHVNNMAVKVCWLDIGVISTYNCRLIDITRLRKELGDKVCLALSASHGLQDHDFLWRPSQMLGITKPAHTKYM